jgi:hypothetical protein
MPTSELETTLAAEPPSELSDDDAEPTLWREYADYVYEQTIASRRQAEVIAADRFGIEDLSAALDVTSATVTTHRDAIGDKRSRAALFGQLTDPSLDAPGIAPVRLATATHTDNETTYDYAVFANAAYGSVIGDLPSAANTQYILVRDRHTSSATTTTFERTIEQYTDRDEYTLAGVAIRRVPADACARIRAEFGEVIHAGSTQQLLDRRGDLYPSVEAAYQRVLTGETAPETIAQTYGVKVDHITRNITEANR